MYALAPSPTILPAFVGRGTRHKATGHKAALCLVSPVNDSIMMESSLTPHFEVFIRSQPSIDSKICMFNSTVGYEQRDTGHKALCPVSIRPASGNVLPQYE